MINNTALQVTNFNFYGDELIALKDSATGEIYTSINSVLRGIGFSTDRQIQYQRDKWLKDRSISKGVSKFVIPTQSGNQDTNCISIRKLPLALAKINITKRLERDYPHITEKLELFQDKCADILASIFLDHKTTDQITMQPILDTLNTFTRTVNDTLLSTTMYLWLIPLTASKELSILLLKLYNDGAIGMSASFLGLRVRIKTDNQLLIRSVRFMQVESPQAHSCHTTVD